MSTMPRLSAATTRAARTTRNTRNGPTALQTRLVSFLREARWILFAALAAWLADVRTHFPVEINNKLLDSKE